MLAGNGFNAVDHLGKKAIRNFTNNDADGMASFFFQALGIPVGFVIDFFGMSQNQGFGFCAYFMAVTQRPGYGGRG
jgi:hypothetical protein